jgi:hypothetical protein
MLDALAQLVRSGDQIISELLDANDKRQHAFRESMTSVTGRPRVEWTAVKVGPQLVGSSSLKSL